MDLALAGRLVVVTGADSGIGLHTAMALAAEGARVLLSDTTDEALDAALRRVREHAGDADAHAVSADVTVPSEVEGLRAAADELGGAWGLAHLAGTRGAAGDFLSLSDDDWRGTLDVDLMGAVRVCRAFLPGMLERGRGRIVLTASENAVRPTTDETPYNAAKAGVVNLGKALSMAYGPRGVHTNVVSPAFVRSPMTDAMMAERARERGVAFEDAVAGFLDEEREGITVERRGRPEEVAAVIAFLLSERASYVDGANWRVDGGAVPSAFG